MNHDKVFLREVAHSQTGPFGSQLHQKDYVPHGTPIVTVEHLGDTGFLRQNLPFVSDKDKARLFKYVLKEGDIVFSRVGSVDKCTYVSSEEDGWMFSGRCIRVRCNSNVSPKFLSFYFRLEGFKKMMRSIAVGATMPSLNTSLMDNIPLFLPPINEQHKIAAVLSAIDAKIECNNRINAELEAMAKILHDYWFVQFDFPDKDGRPYKSTGGRMCYSPALKREIPAGWKAGLASDLFDFNPNSPLKKGEEAGYLDMDSLPLTGFMTKQPKRKIFSGGVKFRNNDVAVARITPCLENGKTGLISMLEENEVGFGSTEFIILRGKKNPLPGFVTQLSRSASFRKFAISNMTGTSGRKRIDAKTLETYSLPLPPEDILLRYEKVVGPFFKRMTNNAKENSELTQLRDWLLPMLMNGQVTVM